MLNHASSASFRTSQIGCTFTLLARGKGTERNTATGWRRRQSTRFKLLENYWIHVTCDRRNYKLVGMSKENFPALPQFPHALVKIPAKLLADLIAKTTFAISLEESRYTLNGALMVLKPGSITMVATDGHRLAMVERDHKFEGFSAETRVLIPKKAMTEVQRLAAESGDDAQIEFAQDESQLEPS